MRFVLLASALAFVPAAFAGETEVRQRVEEIQGSERLVAAAIRTNDVAELTRQQSAPLSAGSAILHDPMAKQFIPCIEAGFGLASIAIAASSTPSASTYLKLREERDAFPVKMMACEALLGLTATRLPNLGRPAR